MTNQELGQYLKSKARASGNFVPITIDNVYNTVDSLSYFFYNKKHEWVAICFIDNDYVCHKIWFEKGQDRKSVAPSLTIDKTIKLALRSRMKHIVILHNHPLSSLDMPNYGNRRINISASYEYKKQALTLSDADESYLQDWVEQCDKNNLGFGLGAMVAGEMFFKGEVSILKNISDNMPAIRTFRSTKSKSRKKQNECFIATATYGTEADETLLLRQFRDDILYKTFAGRCFCMIYYKISPPMARIISKSQIIKKLTLFLLEPIILMAKKAIGHKN